MLLQCMNQFLLRKHDRLCQWRLFPRSIRWGGDPCFHSPARPRKTSVCESEKSHWDQVFCSCQSCGYNSARRAMSVALQADGDLVVISHAKKLDGIGLLVRVSQCTLLALSFLCFADVCRARPKLRTWVSSREISYNVGLNALGRERNWVGHVCPVFVHPDTSFVEQVENLSSYPYRFFEECGRPCQGAKPADVVQRMKSYDFLHWMSAFTHRRDGEVEKVTFRPLCLLDVG